MAFPLGMLIFGPLADVMKISRFAVYWRKRCVRSDGIQLFPKKTEFLNFFGKTANLSLTNLLYKVDASNERKKEALALTIEETALWFVRCRRETQTPLTKSSLLMSKSGAHCCPDLWGGSSGRGYCPGGFCDLSAANRKAAKSILLFILVF